MTGPDLAELLPSWELALRSERKSPSTIKVYGDGVKAFLRWCDANGHAPALDRTLLKLFVAGLLDGGAEPATAGSRQMAVRRFSAWLAEEGEIASDPLLGLKPPKLDAKVTEALSDDELRRLVKACAGEEFVDRRDEALIRLMAETGMRAGEACSLQIDDVDLRGRPCKVVIRRGKGGRGRAAPFGPDTARALDRYVRARRAHRLADTSDLWLGGGGQSFGYSGLHKTLRARATTAGLTGFHPHLLRHTAATRWLAAGGSENGLMAVAGWRTRSMLDRYTQASASDRAADESLRLRLGEL